MKVFHLEIYRLLTLAAVVAVSGCSRAEFAFKSTSTFGQENPPTVCAPGEPTGTPGTNQNGLAGKIKYMTATEASASRPTGVDDLLSRGADAGVNLVLNQLNVPGVKFTEGFYNPATKTPLKTASGDVLIEWFAIDLFGELLLSDTEEEGYYQLALISDDGAILKIDETATVAGTTLIDNDGEHPTRMGCANKPVYLKKSETLPIRVKYYQGPRTHIALSLVWRKVANMGAANDAYCGLTGNDVFWNTNVVPSAPTAKFDDLVARGWTIPSAKNFVLPPSVRTNPCI